MSLEPATPSGRSAAVERKTRETDIALQLGLDGSGSCSVNTGIGFFDHMLELFAAHGRFDLSLEAKGDLDTGGHHTVEDVGICLGLALDRALGDRSSITRYASVHMPMDESLALVALDVSGRPYLAYEVDAPSAHLGGLDTHLSEEFFRAVVNNARMTMHVRLLAGTNPHHVVEAVFKGFARALHAATRVDPALSGIPSTKGVL